MRTRFTGLRAWWIQRVSAGYMLLFMLFALASLGLHPLRSYPAWRASVERPVVSIAALVFFAALFSHIWVGLRDVLLDYARPAGVRRVLLAVVAIGLLGMAAFIAHVFVLLRT